MIRSVSKCLSRNQDFFSRTRSEDFEKRNVLEYVSTFKEGSDEVDKRTHETSIGKKDHL